MDSNANIPAKDMNIRQNELKRRLHYDPETGIFTWLVDFSNGVCVGDVAGSIHKTLSGKCYWKITLSRVNCKAHRLAFLYMLGYMPLEVDHSDGNGLNNKWGNLFGSNPQENSKNLRMPVHNTSDFVGVGWHKQSGKWNSRINIKGKDVNLGRFIDKDDAINARKAANVSHGFHFNHGSRRPL